MIYMLNFIDFTENELPLVMSFLKKPDFKSCDYTVGTLYQWRKVFCSRIAASDGLLFINECYAGVGRGYLLPTGQGDMNVGLSLIEEHAKYEGLPLRYCEVTSEGLEILRERYGASLVVTPRPDWSDYIYPTEQFQEYRGNRLHTQRNHVNRFYRDNPNAVSLPLSKELEGLCLELCSELSGRDDVSEIERNEIIGAMELIRLRDALGLLGCCIVSNGRLEAFAVGELIGDMLYEHVEKARSDASGAFPAMAQAFVKAAGAEALWLNREDDVGDEGIRESKQRYRPDHMIYKYMVQVL